MEGADVLIVGAGAAGLMAARELSKAGKKVLILEARDRVGGRIYPLPQDEWGYPAQGGAEFVHGEAPVTTALVAEAGGTLIPVIGERWSMREGKLQQLKNAPPENPVFVQKLLDLKEDISVVDFFDLHLAGEEYAGLRTTVFGRLEGYDAADPTKASSFSLREEITGEESYKNSRIKEGYGRLLNFLVSECKKHTVVIELGKEVKEVNFQNEGVTVRCSDGEIYKTDRVIVTVPLPLIKSIVFTPSIPEKFQAVDDIGFGSATKVLLRFKEEWWTTIQEGKFKKMSFMLSNEFIPSWWTLYPQQYPLLIGWLAGPKAAALSKQSETEISMKALLSLSKTFTVPIEELRDQLVTSKVVNWIDEQFAQGAYSYSMPATAATAEILSNPVKNKIFFAGEAINPGTARGTVEAAVVSGKKVAQQILRS